MVVRWRLVASTLALSPQSALPLRTARDHGGAAPLQFIRRDREAGGPGAAAQGVDGIVLDQEEQVLRRLARHLFTVAAATCSEAAINGAEHMPM